MNLAILSGKVINLSPTNQNVILGVLQDNTEVYYIFWEKHNFNNINLDSLEGKYVNVIANIELIKIKLPEKVKPATVAGYKVKELEIINDI